MSEDGQFIPIDLTWNELGLSYLTEDWVLDVDNHPEPVKVRICKITADRITVASVDYSYPADLGTSFELPNGSDGAPRRSPRKPER